MVLPDSAQRLQSRGHARRAGSEAARSPLRRLESRPSSGEARPTIANYACADIRIVIQSTDFDSPTSSAHRSIQSEPKAQLGGGIPERAARKTVAPAQTAPLRPCVTP
jgi:hypothetical protein